MLRYILFFALVLFCIPCYSQTISDFIRSYNKHIDPNNALDSFDTLFIKKELHATGSFNSTPIEYTNIHDCQFYSNGNSKCSSQNTGGKMDLSTLPTVKNRDTNDIKTQLNFLPINEDTTHFRFKAVNDSITVIEQFVNPTQSFVFTFDTKTKDLLLIENQSFKDETLYKSRTRYLSYHRVNGILVSKKISFQNNYFNVSLENTSCSFR